MVDNIPDGHTFAKADSGSKQTVRYSVILSLLQGIEELGGGSQTKTPAVLYTRDMFYMAGNVSSMVNVKWFFGQ